INLCLRDLHSHHAGETLVRTDGRRGIHEAILVWRSLRKPVDRRIRLEDGSGRWSDLRRWRDRRGRSAAAPGDPVAAQEQARIDGRRRVAVHDGTGTRWRGGEAFDYPYDRARTLETHRRRVGRLAEDHLQSEVLAGDGLRRSVGGLSAGQSGISEGKKVSWKIFWRSERDSQTVPDTNGTYLTPVRPRIRSGAGSERRPKAARGEWLWMATALRSEEVEGHAGMTTAWRRFDSARCAGYAQRERLRTEWPQALSKCHSCRGQFRGAIRRQIAMRKSGQRKLSGPRRRRPCAARHLTSSVPVSVLALVRRAAGQDPLHPEQPPQHMVGNCATCSGATVQPVRRSTSIRSPTVT